jgi:hypothetical protein
MSPSAQLSPASARLPRSPQWYLSFDDEVPEANEVLMEIRRRGVFVSFFPVSGWAPPVLRVGSTNFVGVQEILRFLGGVRLP